MTEKIQILLCTWCGETSVVGEVDPVTYKIHSCEKCKKEDETNPNEEAIANAFLSGLRRGIELELPDGYILAPIKPTSDMITATYPLVLRSPETIYAAMMGVLMRAQESPAPSPDHEG